jgi:hypothetical protein
MSSWGPGFVQKRGHMILPYHHFVGFGDYADEFFKLVRSTYYAYSANEFLFVFDKANSIQASYSLFESTLKRATYIRYLSYYPSQGFNLCERADLVNPILQRGPQHEKLSFFSLCSTLFVFQDSIKGHIYTVYQRKNLGFVEPYDVGLCLVEGQSEFSSIVERITRFAKRPIDPLSVFVSTKSREQYIQFRDACPKQWTVVSMWETIPAILVTEEQKLDSLYSYLGSIILLSQCTHLMGSFNHSIFRLLYSNEPRFRTPSSITVLDGSSFSYF